MVRRARSRRRSSISRFRAPRRRRTTPPVSRGDPRGASPESSRACRSRSSRRVRTRRSLRRATPAPPPRPVRPPRPPEPEQGDVAGPDVDTVAGASATSPAAAESGVPAGAVHPVAVAPDHRVTVSSGDSLYLIFKRLGLPQRDLAMMTGVKPLAKKLARIAPRQEIEFYVDTESRLTRLVHRLDRLRSLHVFRDGDAFAFEEVVESPEVAVATATGVIESSLFEAGQHAGLSDSLIMQMAGIFGWDVDFALDIRAGDRFALVFEERFKDGEKIGEGPIVAAEFTNRGRRIRAVRYADPDGRADYFSPDGRSMRKAFLRTPVNFTRISSRFSFNRRHPILHRMRAHRGVDYAAPRGTAVKASGDGRIVFAGRKGGYGRTIMLPARIGLHHGLRAPLAVLEGDPAGEAGRAGADHRIRREHRPCHRPSPSLRVSRSRRPSRPAQGQASPGPRRWRRGTWTTSGEKAKPLLATLESTARTALATAD